jgi:ABC-2 type transport system ATP-binding protein
VSTRNGEGVEARVRELVAEAGLSLESVRPIEPSLEDVFVAVLAGGKETRGAP